MFIWVAIDVDEQLFKQKKKVSEIEKEIGFVQSNVSLLPLHISLKISTDISNKNEESIRKDIYNLLNSKNQFEIEVDGIELNDSIVWIKMKQNDNLLQLHSSLCSLFKDKYGIKLNEYDESFVYHTTLFLDLDRVKITKAFSMVKSISLPKKLIANRFIIGSSPTGTIGTYVVDSTIEVMPSS